MEPFIRKHFGELIFCMTIPGTDFFHDTEQKIEDIGLHFIQQEEITDIIVVNDLDCPFLTAIIETKKNQNGPLKTYCKIFLYHST